MSNETPCVNSILTDRYLNEEDQIEQSIEYVVKKNESLLQEAKDAIYEYNQAMIEESKDLDLSTDWWDLKDDLEIS